jgi:hypothetical protein
MVVFHMVALVEHISDNMIVRYTFITRRNPFAENFADAVGQCALAGNTWETGVGRGMNKVIDKRRAISRGETLHLVADIGVPGEKSGFIKRTRRRFENKTFIAVKSSYVSAREFGGENDYYGGERSWCRFGANMTLSGRMGHHESDLLYGREETTVSLLDR